MSTNIHVQIQEPRRTIAIAATFTAEPVEEPLQFWMQQLGIECNIRFAPYNQVFQQLLDPAGVLAQTGRGLNVLLVRLEDWWRGAGDLAGAGHGENVQERLARHVEDLMAALRSAANHTAVPQLLCLCPASPALLQDKAAARELAQLEQRITAALADASGIYAVSSADLLAHYPVLHYDDRKADDVGRVPYTREFFYALGTMIMRRYHAIHSAPAKLIVLDCDHTLWRGICGEDGPSGVVVDAACQYLQRFLIEQRRAGTALALCTKNNEDDVWRVFDENPGMILQRDDVLISRINWQPKSENILSLAAELNLGLESMVFLDDSPLECAEVEARCPQVLTLQVPDSEAALARLLRHVWSFDHLKFTMEDRQRGELYARQMRREQLRRRSLSLDEFLSALELQIDIRPMNEAEIPRVAQLTQRTNQFNFTAVRLTPSELEHQWRGGALEVAVLTLIDRFGDYGLVGAAFYGERNGWIEVNNILLSCRALGRRVEHHFLSWLDRLAGSRKLSGLKIHFTPSARNRPARDFLIAIGAAPADAAWPRQFTCGRIGELCKAARAPAAIDHSAGDEATAEVSAMTDEAESRNRLLRRIATELADPKSISQAIAEWSPIQHRGDPGYVPPATPLEEALAGIWADFLGLDKVGVEDNFFALGGQSLTAMQIVFAIRESFGVELSLEDFLEAKNLAEQAQQLENLLMMQADQDELTELLAELAQGAEPQIASLQRAGGRS